MGKVERRCREVLCMWGAGRGCDRSTARARPAWLPGQTSPPGNASCFTKGPSCTLGDLSMPSCFIICITRISKTIHAGGLLHGLARNPTNFVRDLDSSCTHQASDQTLLTSEPELV